MRIWVLILIALIAIGAVLLTQPTRDEIPETAEDAASETGETDAPLRGRAVTGEEGPVTDAHDEGEVEVDADGGGPDRSRTLRVSGHFLDADGVGVAFEPITMEGSAWDWRSVVKTAADGSFEADLPEEVAPIRVLPGRRNHPLEHLAQEATRESPEVELRLPADRLFSGYVVDERGGPIAGAEVRIGGTRARTGRDGAFRMYLWGLTLRRKLIVDPPAALKQVGYLPLTVEDVDGGERSRRVVLERQSGLFGMLRWTDGEPVKGAHVVMTNQRILDARPDDPNAWLMASVHGHSEGDGTLAIGPLADATYMIAVSHGRPRRFVDELEATAPGARLSLTVRRPVALGGRVTGGSVDGCTVLWTPTGTRSAVELTRCATHTDAAGRFKFFVPAHFAGQLHVRSPSGSEYAVRELHPRDGGNLAIALQPGLSIKGTASGWPTKPPPFSVAVEATQGSLSARASVNADGTFSIEGLAPGRWTVRLEVYNATRRHDSSWGATAEVEAGTSDVTLVATKRGR